MLPDVVFGSLFLKIVAGFGVFVYGSTYTEGCTIRPHLNRTVVKERSSLTLACVFHCSNRALKKGFYINWTKDSVPINNTRNFKSSDGKSVVALLILNRVRSRDKGLYECTIKTDKRKWSSEGDVIVLDDVDSSLQIQGILAITLGIVSFLAILVNIYMCICVKRQKNDKTNTEVLNKKKNNRSRKYSNQSKLFGPLKLNDSGNMFPHMKAPLMENSLPREGVSVVPMESGEAAVFQAAKSCMPVQQVNKKYENNEKGESSGNHLETLYENTGGKYRNGRKKRSFSEPCRNPVPAPFDENRNKSKTIKGGNISLFKRFSRKKDRSDHPFPQARPEKRPKSGTEVDPEGRHPKMTPPTDDSLPIDKAPESPEKDLPEDDLSEDDLPDYINSKPHIPIRTENNLYDVVTEPVEEDEEYYVQFNNSGKGKHFSDC